MLYLIKSNDKLKIGYAKDIPKRLKTYKTHNLDVELLSSKEGSFTDETFLHNILKSYKIDLEWFHLDDYVIELFNKHKPIVFHKEQEF